MKILEKLDNSAEITLYINSPGGEVVSGLADIGRTHLSAIERGLRKPTLETFFRIAEAMRVSPSELMKLIEDAH